MSWLPVVGAAKNRVVALKTDRSISLSLTFSYFLRFISSLFRISKYGSKAKIRAIGVIHDNTEIITRAISAILKFAFYPITLLRALLFVY